MSRMTWWTGSKHLVFYSKQGPGFERESTTARLLLALEKFSGCEEPLRNPEIREAAGAVLTSAAGRIVAISETPYMLDEAEWAGARHLLQLAQQVTERPAFR